MTDFIFLEQMVIAAMKLKDAFSLKEKLWPKLDSILKSRQIAGKGLSSQSYGLFQ